ncbi:MTA/SAH nucleosidase [Pseudoramibacter alactolyticus ATCC 23263]|uniref:adenosylhomocysteine nucleosidase n=2 Tax=Pseudoramibacter TaxID=113286 RepID=E6MI03_9FIRM|nr:MTA/SAH nucleosidase [Pseudoramibacter alactolyticus ATCC 23263]
MIGVIAALPEEAAVIAGAMRESRASRSAGVAVTCGIIGGREVVLAQSGVGKVNAALCAQALISVYAVDCVINVGVAGALDRRLTAGQLVVAKDCVQYDVDATAAGFDLGEVPGMRQVAYTAAPNLVALAEAVAHKLNVTTRIGRVLTGDRVVASAALKQALADHFGGLCAEMEGAAVGQVAAVNQVPFAVIRGISDLADEALNEAYQTHYARAAVSAGLVAAAMIALMPVH